MECKRVSAYSKENLRNNKSGVIMIDPDGIKAIGRWAKISTYNAQNAPDGIRRWAMSVIHSKYKDMEITASGALSIIEDMIAAMNEAIFVSTILNINIQFSYPTQKTLKQLIDRSNKALTEVMPTSFRGKAPIPVTVLCPDSSVVSKNGTITRSEGYVKKDGTLGIRKKKYTVASIGSAIADELVQTNYSLKSKGIFGRGRPPKKKKKQEAIKQRTKRT